MTPFDRATAAMEDAFGIGIAQATVILRENAAAKRIYDCAIQALMKQWEPATLPPRTFAAGPLQFALAPNESIEPGDWVTLDAATGKLRKYVSGVDTGRAFTVPPGSRVNENGYLEMPR